MSRDADRTDALALLSVSRETMERLDVFVALLARWRSVVNLVSESSFDRVWTRHIADSAQLPELATDARVWVDMGSGAGFPGMIIAIQLAGLAEARVHLIESDQRKCAFLGEAARATGAPAVVHNVRIESAASIIREPVDAVTARAVAPLPRLIGFATLWLDRGAVGLFPRGRTGDAELSVFQKDKEYAFSSVESRLDRSARIVIVRKTFLASRNRPGLAEN